MPRSATPLSHTDGSSHARTWTPNCLKARHRIVIPLLTADQLRVCACARARVCACARAKTCTHSRARKCVCAPALTRACSTYCNLLFIVDQQIELVEVAVHEPCTVFAHRRVQRATCDHHAACNRRQVATYEILLRTQTKARQPFGYRQQLRRHSCPHRISRILG